jgi:NTE family protein
MFNGLPAFFKPNPLAMMGNAWPLGAEHAGHYSTAPLRQTLADLVDFDRINRHETRISVGAANVCSKAGMTMPDSV